LLIGRRSERNTHGGAASWLRRGFFLAIAAGGPLAAFYADSTVFPELEGNWVVTSGRRQPVLPLPEKFRIEPSGLIKNIGLVGSGFCGRNCYALHLLRTGTEYRLSVSLDGQTIEVSADDPNAVVTASRVSRNPR
jgi:hypothetical protein